MSNVKTCVYVVFIAFMTTVFSPAYGEDHGWVTIFNGKDLSGWSMKIKGYETGDNHKNTFRVEEGVLKVSYDQYSVFNNTFGHLFFMEELSHYRLRLNYRFIGEQVEGGPGWAYKNSGIMVHGQHPDTMGLDQNFPVSIETQLLGGNGHDERPTANVCSPGTHYEKDGVLVKEHCINSTSKTFHDDGWVNIEVEVRGNKIIRHLINGELVFELEKPQLDLSDPEAKALNDMGYPLMISKGYFSLQSESHGIEFRDIELLRLEEK